MTALLAGIRLLITSCGGPRRGFYGYDEGDRRFAPVSGSYFGGETSALTVNAAARRVGGR